MRHARSIWLVARREIIERGRSRGFVFSVLFTTAIVIAGFVIPAVLFAEDEAIDVAVVAPLPDGLETTLTSIAAAQAAVVVVTEVADQAMGEAALADESADALLIIPADLSGPGEVRFQDETDDGIVRMVAAAVAQLRLVSALTESGVDPGILASSATPPEVTAVEPVAPEDEAAFFFANIGAVLILVGIFSFGFTVLTGVVEEKQSRVVEVVLSTVRPRDLLMGKVLGIGVLGLVQLAVFVVAGLLAASLTDQFALPPTTGAAIVMLAVWFILGYALYSTALGFLGALASRMEEASNASSPVTIVAMVCYFASIFVVVRDPTGTAAVILTFVPPAAPFVVPLRAALDAISLPEMLGAIVVTLIAVWLLFVVGARIYAGAVLQTTGRMKLRDAWRASRE
ncbi:MAG TPA: ABC transporter permease [Candidatus Limnocylindrales bacterium]|jgi:ABC-2 type transport system permease protein